MGGIEFRAAGQLGYRPAMCSLSRRTWRPKCPATPPALLPFVPVMK
jgi:hypothetical protein